ncbi:MAG: hypothetical protein RL322_3311 [Pseudomonadota bacterium]
MSPTLMIMAGGTGGHVMPGLAVAEQMRARDWQVVWLGHPEGIEGRLTAGAGIPLEPLRFRGLRGKGLVAKLLLPIRLLSGFGQSLRALRRTRPSVVLGMGGYPAFPGAMMASLLGVPLVIHEQNSIAGLTNRVLARLADRVLEAFPGSLPGAQCTGNPLRQTMIDVPPPAERYAARSGPLELLVVGGSLGAQVFNQGLPDALSRLAPDQRPRITHQTGKGRAESVARDYAERGVEARVVEFIDDIGAAYAQADLVIARAGAMTVSELAAVGVASILVPYPYAVDDHQTTNARHLAQSGAAVLMPQEAFAPAALATLIQSQSRESARIMAERARALSRADAAQAVAQVCQELAR